MSYQQYDREINGLRYTAKRRLNLRNDEELAKLCGCSASLIRNRGSEKKLPNLDFWTVAQMAKAAGKTIIFVDDFERR